MFGQRATSWKYPRRCRRLCDAPVLRVMRNLPGRRGGPLKRSVVWLTSMGLFNVGTAFGLGAALYLAGSVTLGTAFL